MHWKPLIEIDEVYIGRGYVFRFPAKHPFEAIVDFMIIEDLDAPIQLKVICSSGYHSGQTEFNFPLEAGKKYALSTDWLKTNWNKWVYQECDVESVLYIKNYETKNT